MMHNTDMEEGLSSVHLLTTFSWILFGAGVALAALLGAVLWYHWVQFSMNRRVTAIALIAYTIGSVVLLLTMLGSLLAL